MKYSCFLLECREDEERQADFCRRGLYTTVRGDGQLYQWCHFNKNLMVSNNIIIVFL